MRSPPEVNKWGHAPPTISDDIGEFMGIFMQFRLPIFRINKVDGLEISTRCQILLVKCHARRHRSLCGTTCWSNGFRVIISSSYTKAQVGGLFLWFLDWRKDVCLWRREKSSLWDDLCLSTWVCEYRRRWPIDQTNQSLGFVKEKCFVSKRERNRPCWITEWGFAHPNCRRWCAHISQQIVLVIHVLFACLDAGGKGDKGTQARGFLRNYLQFSCDFGPVPGEDGQSLTFVPFLNARLFYEEYEMRCVCARVCVCVCVCACAISNDIRLGLSGEHRHAKSNIIANWTYATLS